MRTVSPHVLYVSTARMFLLIGGVFDVIVYYRVFINEREIPPFSRKGGLFKPPFRSIEVEHLCPPRDVRILIDHILQIEGYDPSWYWRQELYLDVHAAKPLDTRTRLVDVAGTECNLGDVEPLILSLQTLNYAVSLPSCYS